MRVVGPGLAPAGAALHRPQLISERKGEDVRAEIEVLAAGPLGEFPPQGLAGFAFTFKPQWRPGRERAAHPIDVHRLQAGGFLL